MIHQIAQNRICLAEESLVVGVWVFGSASLEPSKSNGQSTDYLRLSDLVNYFLSVKSNRNLRLASMNGSL